MPEDFRIAEIADTGILQHRILIIFYPGTAFIDTVSHALRFDLYLFRLLYIRVMISEEGY